MQDMIFDKKLSFEEIIDTLQALEDEINSWENYFERKCIHNLANL